jgi:CDP-glucose 4,6-dehydratase
LAVANYRQAYFADQSVAVASVRAGNVIGGGDWSDDRLIPDAIRAWQRNVPLIVRSAAAVRPWQHVIEPLHGYLVLAEKLWGKPSLASCYNFGPRQEDCASVERVIEEARSVYGGGEVEYLAKNDGPHEASRLTLDISKASAVLKVSPVWTLSEALRKTVEWYQAARAGKDARQLCSADIDDYRITASSATKATQTETQL